MTKDSSTGAAEENILITKETKYKLNKPGQKLEALLKQIMKQLNVECR